MLTLSTDAVPAKDAFPYWREVLAQHFIHLRPEPVRLDGFASAIDAQTLGGCSFSRVRAGAQRVYRTPREIARSPRDLVFLNVHVSGAGSYKQCGGERTLRAGDIFVIDAVEPFELGVGEGMVTLSLKAPRVALWEKLRRTEDAAGAFIPAASYAGRLIGAYATALWEGEQENDAALDHLFALTSFEIDRRRSETRLPRAAVRAALYARVKAYIRAACADTRLDPRAVARAAGVSLRTLQNVFAEHGDAIARRIQAERLVLAARMLAAPDLRRRKVGEIAFLAGFSELSHFTHAFVRAHGETPGTWRRRRLEAASG